MLATYDELEVLFPASSPTFNFTTFEFVANFSADQSARRSGGTYLPAVRYVLVSTGTAQTSYLWIGIVGKVLRASFGSAEGPTLVEGNMYPTTVYVDAPLSVIEKHTQAAGQQHSPLHRVLVELRPGAMGSMRLWVDNVLYGISNTFGEDPVPGIVWADSAGEVVDTVQPVKFFRNQFVSRGSNRMPHALPGLVAQFGIDVGLVSPFVFRV